MGVGDSQMRGEEIKKHRERERGILIGKIEGRR